MEILYFIQNNLKNPLFDELMPFLSMIGEHGAIWIAVCLSMIFFKKTRTMGIAGLLAMVAAFATGEIIMKNIFCRIRPCYIDTTVKMLVARPKSYSFPSGHTSSSFACATVFFIYNKKIGIPALILAALIAFSRMYNFVHFTSDVLAGAALGILAAAAAVLLMKAVRPRFERSDLEE